MIDWSIEVVGMICYHTVLVAFASLFIRLCLYVTGMVEDIKIQLTQLDEQSSTTNAADCLRARSVHVREIQFHVEVFEYAYLITLFWLQFATQFYLIWSKICGAD